MLASVSLASCADGEVAGYSDILINEVQSSATTGYLAEDFVELYNASAADYTFAEGEWYLTDADGAEEHVFYIPGGTVIGGNSYLVLLPNVTSDEDLAALDPAAPDGAIACVDDGTNLDFGLSSADSISLYYLGEDNADPTAATDSAAWSAHVMTWVRYPDGGDWSATFAHTPTPGAANVE